MDDAWDVAQAAEQDVDEEIAAATPLKEHTDER